MYQKILGSYTAVHEKDDISFSTSTADHALLKKVVVDEWFSTKGAVIIRATRSGILRRRQDRFSVELICKDFSYPSRQCRRMLDWLWWSEPMQWSQIEREGAAPRQEYSIGAVVSVCTGRWKKKRNNQNRKNEELSRVVVDKRWFGTGCALLGVVNKKERTCGELDTKTRLQQHEDDLIEKKKEAKKKNIYGETEHGDNTWVSMKEPLSRRRKSCGLQPNLHFSTVVIEVGRRASRWVQWPRIQEYDHDRSFIRCIYLMIISCRQNR